MKKAIIGVVAVAAAATLVFTYASNNTTTTIVKHTFEAPAEIIWEMWKDPKFIQQWWSPRDYTAPIINNDFQVGGVYLFSMKAPDGKMIYNVGKYSEIVPLKKIVSTMSFSDEKGNVVPASQYGIPGKWPDSVHITVEFDESDGKTQVKVIEKGIPLIMYVFSKMGWRQQFEKFDALVAQH
jgi:uncharacterized protein YndB with AHSA1/START domain